MLTPMQTIAAIAVMALVTFLTRALPFLLFDRSDHPPKLVLYLGRVLPPAVIAMLIVYCLKDALLSLGGNLTSAFSAPVLGHWLPALIALVVVVLLHCWKHNNLLSIFGGTILYMFLVQAVFVYQKKPAAHCAAGFSFYFTTTFSLPRRSSRSRTRAGWMRQRVPTRFLQSAKYNTAWLSPGKKESTSFTFRRRGPPGWADGDRAAAPPEPEGLPSPEDAGCPP